MRWRAVLSLTLKKKGLHQHAFISMGQRKQQQRDLGPRPVLHDFPGRRQIRYCPCSLQRSGLMRGGQKTAVAASPGEAHTACSPVQPLCLVQQTQQQTLEKWQGAMQEHDQNSELQSLRGPEDNFLLGLSWDFLRWRILFLLALLLRHAGFMSRFCRFEPVNGARVRVLVAPAERWQDAAQLRAEDATERISWVLCWKEQRQSFFLMCVLRL